MSIFRITLFLLSGMIGSVMFVGAVGGCGGSAPSQAATTLAGAYDCIDGCSGDCTFSDKMEIETDRVFPDENRTTLNVDCTIETELNVFTGSEGNGGVLDSGEFGFIFTGDNGDIECAGTSAVSGDLALNCIAIEVVGDESFEKNCQVATYKKK